MIIECLRSGGLNKKQRRQGRSAGYRLLLPFFPICVNYLWKENNMNKLAAYTGNMSVINKTVRTGALTVGTENGKPRVGTTKEGTPYINGIKFVEDGPEGKQASHYASAFGETAELLTQLIAEAPIKEGKKAPFFRIMVDAKLRGETREVKDENGEVVLKDDGTPELIYENKLLITDCWNAPVAGDTQYFYPESS